MRRDFVLGASTRFLMAVLAIAMPPLSAFAVEPEPAAAAPVAIPDTPEGRRLAWMIEALNAERVPQPDEVRAQFSPERFRDEAVMVRILQLARDAMAPVRLESVREPPDEPGIIARIRDRDGDVHRLSLTTDAYSGDRIGGWGLVPGESLAPNQFGVTAFDPVRSSPLPGAPIEILDGTTGEPLDPPQRCMANFLGYCRFTLPDGLATVAIKLTHVLLFSRMDSYHYIPANILLASGDFWLPWALPRSRMDWILESLGMHFDPEKGYLGGFVAYFGANDHKRLGQAGCATVELTPQPAKLVYSLSDRERAATSSTDGWWFAPGVEAGAYEATARVGSRVGSLRLPKVVPGANHVPLLPIYLDGKDEMTDVPRCD